MEVSEGQLMYEKIICMMNQMSRKSFCNKVRRIAIQYNLCSIEYPDEIILYDNDGLTINFAFAKKGGKDEM